MRNFRKIILSLVFVSLILVINQMLMLALKPVNFIRNDVHNIKTKKYDNVYIGTSHGKAAINPQIVDEITGKKSVNICLGGQYPIDSYYLIKEICRHNKPESIVYELDPGYWVSKASLGPDYSTIYEEMPFSLVKLEYFREKMLDVDFRTTIFPWYVYRQGYKNIYNTIKLKFSQPYLNYEDSVYSNQMQSYGNHGAVSIHRVDMPKSEDNMVLWEQSKLERESVTYFEKIVKLCKEEGIKLVVVTTPVPKETIEKYSSNYLAADEYFKTYFSQREIPYYNFNLLNIPGFDYTVNGFSDYEGHMYDDQAKIFSRELGKILIGQSVDEIP